MQHNNNITKDIFKKYPISVIKEALKIVDAYLEQKKNQSLIKREQIDSLEDFIYKYFAHYIKVDFGQIQKEIIKDISLLRGRQNRKPIRESIAAPRGYAKSTLVTLIAVIWLILNKEHFFIIILSSNKSTAQGFLQIIIDEIEQNDKLINDYPELLPAKDFKNQTVAWRDSEIVMKNGVRVMAFGWLNSIRGLRKKNIRPDLVICDDPDEEKDVASETKMNRKYRWFDRAVLKLGGIIGIDVIVCYTTISINCIGEYIYKDNIKYSDWIKKKFKAIEVDENKKEYSTWEDAYPLEVLAKERDEDPLGFATERQNEPLSEIDQQFKGFIKLYDFTDYTQFDGMRKVLAIDLSLGKNEKSDYSAIVGCCLLNEGRYREIYSDIQRRSSEQIVYDIIKALLVFDYGLCGVESTGGQEHFIFGLVQMIKEYNKNNTKKITTPIIPIKTSGDKIKRITASLLTYVKTGWLQLRKDSIMLYDQLDNFPYKKLDGPDALSMCIDVFGEWDKNIIKPPAISKFKASAPRTFDVEQLHKNRMDRWTKK